MKSIDVQRSSPKKIERFGCRLPDLRLSQPRYAYRRVHKPLRTIIPTIAQQRLWVMAIVTSDPLAWIILLLGALVLVYHYSTKTDIPKIKGIPEIPGALPMYNPLEVLMTEVSDI